VALLLQTYAKACALVDGNREIGNDAIESVAHVALSCIPKNRRKILKLVLNPQGQLDSATACRLLNATPPTVRSYMKELAATGLVIYARTGGTTPDAVSLAPDWRWLLPGG
jgi:hypothetical protein